GVGALSRIVLGLHSSRSRLGSRCQLQLGRAMLGDYLRGRAARRFAGALLRLLVTGFLVSAASNRCRMPCSNNPTALSKAPSCPTRIIATDRCRSNDGGRNTFTGSIERFLAIKRAGSSPTP